MATSSETIRSGGLAFLAGVVWVALCLLVGWPLNSFAGVLLGGLLGGATYLANRGEVDLAATGLAVLMIPVLLFAACQFSGQAVRREAAAAIETDDSYLVGIAEQIAWEELSQTKDEREAASRSANDNPLAGDDSLEFPAFPSLDAVPPPLRAQAQARWNELPEAEKEQIRSTRARFVNTSYGEQLEHVESPGTTSGWVAVGTLASVLALALSVWPLLAARYLGWEGG